MPHNPEHVPAETYEAATRFDNYELLHRQMGEFADAVKRTADLVFCSEALDEAEFFNMSRQLKISSDMTHDTVENILGSLIYDDATPLDMKLRQAHDLVYENWLIQRAAYAEALGESLDDDEPEMGEEADYKAEALNDFRLFHERSGEAVDPSTLYTDILTDYVRESDRDIKLFIGELIFELYDDEYGQQINQPPGSLGDPSDN